MQRVIERYVEGSGLVPGDTAVVITILAMVLVLLWGSWTALGQFHLWLDGAISLGGLFFGALRVIFVIFGVSWILSTT